MASIQEWVEDANDYLNRTKVKDSSDIVWERGADGVSAFLVNTVGGDGSGSGGSSISLQQFKITDTSVYDEDGIITTCKIKIIDQRVLNRQENTIYPCGAIGNCSFNEIEYTIPAVGIYRLYAIARTATTGDVLLIKDTYVSSALSNYNRAFLIGYVNYFHNGTQNVISITQSYSQGDVFTGWASWYNSAWAIKNLGITTDTIYVDGNFVNLGYSSFGVTAVTLPVNRNALQGMLIYLNIKYSGSSYTFEILQTAKTNGDILPTAGSQEMNILIGSYHAVSVALYGSSSDVKNVFIVQNLQSSYTVTERVV
jgi:hypothetical protein